MKLFASLWPQHSMNHTINVLLQILHKYKIGIHLQGDENSRLIIAHNHITILMVFGLTI